MLAYEEAEPLIESTDDMAQLGLPPSRHASIYQMSLVNKPSTVLRYRKALYCF